MNAQPAASPLSPLRRALAIVALGAVAATVHAQANPRADQVRAMNAQVLQLQSETRRSGTTGSARAAQVLDARAAALRELMAADPTAAEKLAFPAAVLEQLAASFPEQSASLEQRGRWEGEFEHTIEDSTDLRTHRSVYRLHRAGEVLEVKFAGGEPPGLASGRKVALSGLRSGNQVVASELQLGDAAQGATPTGDAEAGATCGPSGQQNVVTVLVNLPSYKLATGMTQDFVRGVLLGNAHAPASQSTPDVSVSDFWQQGSDGKTWIDPASAQVVGPVTLTKDYNKDASGASYCDYYGLASEAMAAVDGQVDFRNFTRVAFVLPPNGACGWAGVANVGCRTVSSPGDGSFTASQSWNRADTMGTRGKGVQLMTHEMGHNLGLSHASSRDFGAEALGNVGSAGTLSEYGDVHSTMGSWNYGFYASSHAANQLGWLGGSNYQVVESSGTYAIQNYEGRPAGVKALKVRRGTGNEAWLWIEGRQNTGLYSSTLNASLFTGALVHYQDSTTGGKSHLLDFTPATTSFSDSALQLGQTWTDPYSNVSVTVTGVSATALTVAVSYGAVPCVPAAPTITASPTGTSTEYGSAARFNISVKNNDSSSCASQTIGLGAAAPTGWTKAFGASSFNLAPGQTATTTLDLGVPSPYALGTYEISTTASAASGNGLARQNVTVIEPVNRLSLAISGSGSVSLSSPVKTCTSSCSTDYLASQAPTVTLTARAGSRTTFTGWSGACTGTASTCTVIMNSDRTVTATFGRSSGGKPKR